MVLLSVRILTMSFLEKKPLVEEIIKWSPAQVIKFLELNKDKLFLNEKHIKIIENEEISGPAFLLLTKEDLRIYGLTGGPSTIILELVKTFKSSSSFQELEEKHELFQKSEKGKKRVIVQEEQAEQTEQTEHDLPTKILKISNVTETDEMDIGDENNNVNVLITNEDIGHYRESAYNYLIEGNINYLADLIKMFFQSRSMMSLNSMNEAVFQVVVEMLLPLPCRVPELRLVNGEKDKSNGRFGFADIFILGSKHEKGNPTLNIVLELKYIRLTGLKYGKHGSLIKPLRAEELDKLDKKLENEDENVVLNRKYMPEHSSKITTVGTIMENGIRQLQNYINIITKGPAIKFEDSGVLDSRVSAIRDSGHIIGYVIMFIGTRRILIRSYGPITTNFCWSQ